MQHETELENIMRRYEQYEAKLLYRRKQMFKPAKKLHVWFLKKVRSFLGRRNSVTDML